MDDDDGGGMSSVSGQKRSTGRAFITCTVPIADGCEVRLRRACY